MSDWAAVFSALAVGCVVAVLTDYVYHRLMHVATSRRPLKALFLHHVAHHRYPADPKSLAFQGHRRVLGLYVLTLGTCAYLAVSSLRAPLDALIMALVFIAPVEIYARAYDPLHRAVHLGSSSWFARTRFFQRIRAHHLAHHEHEPGLFGFRRARAYSLVFPYI